MSAVLALDGSRAASAVLETLIRFGFSRDGEGFRRGDLRINHAGRWTVLKQLLDAPASELPTDLGQPGLWRTVFDSGRAARVFELPDSILELASEAMCTDDNEDDVFGACLAWALATADRKIPAGWQPEPREIIEAVVPKNRLTILARAAVRQGELIHTPQKLALGFPLAPAIAADLPAVRREHLIEFLRDGQSDWSLVRLGVAGAPDRASIHAEIDLTGAPAAALEPLLSASLDSLRFVVSRLVETVEVLTDATVASIALDTAAFPQPLKPSTKDQI